MKLASGITIVPFLHGKQAFARHIRELCLRESYDCIALDLPGAFEDDVSRAVDELPLVKTVVAEDASGPLYYIPVDPCDATIEGIRQSRQNRIPCSFVGYPTLRAPVALPPLPDEHAIETLGFDAYCSLCLRTIGDPRENATIESAAQYIAWKLHDLRTRYSSILALVHFRHIARTLFHMGREQTYNLTFPEPPSYRIESAYVNPDHLYFALGELPFVTGRIEKARHDPFAPEPRPVDAVKDLFCETRDDYYEHREDAVELSPARLQVALTFLRNLTVMSGRFLPSLFDIVEAATGVGGNSYSLRILRSAKYYPYLPLESQEGTVSVGIDRISLPRDNSSQKAINLFRDTSVVWRNLRIKPDPSARQKRRYRFQWNPMGMCSHVPEDRRIEGFNAHLRKKAKRVLSEDLAKTEKFTTSVRDGIDVRETLRNWHTGSIYVKELPPSRGEVDTVIIIFDADNDERYPHRGTWYAEHEEESTLTFYATDPFDDLIGPGIARSTYGGLSLLFPPRPVPNVFELTRNMQFDKLAHRLTYGALTFTEQRAIAYVAARRPDLAIRTLAHRMGKHLVWLPLNTFSNETLRRLRRFHVLNGKHVRSWATRFIGD